MPEGLVAAPGQEEGGGLAPDITGQVRLLTGELQLQLLPGVCEETLELMFSREAPPLLPGGGGQLLPGGASGEEHQVGAGEHQADLPHGEVEQGEVGGQTGVGEGESVGPEDERPPRLTADHAVLVLPGVARPELQPVVGELQLTAVESPVT